MIFSKLTTYYKLLILIVLSSVSFIVFFLTLTIFIKNKGTEVYSKAQNQFTKEVNSLLKLNSEFLIQNLYDKTFWDDLVLFVKVDDEKWFNDLVYPTLKLYDLNYVGIYNTDKKLVRNCSTKNFTTIPIIDDELKKNLDKNKIAHFYSNYKEGFVEVFIATIHPTNDPYKLSKAQGYYYVIRLINKEYIAKLQNISSSKIILSNNITFEKYNENSIKYNVVLKDFNSKIIGSLVFERSFIIEYSNIENIIFIIILFVFVNVIIYVFFLKRWFSNPLYLIQKILKKPEDEDIVALKTIAGEFGNIGSLIEENEIKKRELVFAKLKAEESDKLKSSFLMNLSHEIRTPMNAIIGFSDLLQTKENNNEQNEYIDIIKNNGKTLVAIIDDLVEMSKLDSNLIKPKQDTFNLDVFVNSIYESVSLTNSNDKITLTLDKPKIVFDRLIETDETKLSQIIINLLNNALKFTEEGFVNLKYEIDQLNNKIIFEVSDTGKGIPKEFQDKIFIRFNKLSNESISANEGLGLGLAISKAYVEMLGGEITLTSQEKVGSVFTFWIPLNYIDLTKNFSQINIKSEEQLEKTDLREIILIAEDDNINFLLLDKMLKLINAKTIRAKDGSEAVEICKTNKAIDLIFMDIKMPNMNGYTAFEEIRKFNKEVPIIAQTSFSFPEEINKIKSIGFDDFISKPLDKDKIFELVKKHSNKIN